MSFHALFLFLLSFFGGSVMVSLMIISSKLERIGLALESIDRQGKK